MRALATLLIGAAVAVGFLPAQATNGSIDVPAGARAVLETRGEGVQIYGCATSAGGVKWVLQGPDAKLEDASGMQIGTHYAGPTWKLNDGSQVQGLPMASQPSPDAGSVAWLLLRARPGTATGKLAEVAFIRRTETQGGIPDPSGCQSAADAGKTVRVPYTATYTFYAEK